MTQTYNHHATEKMVLEAWGAVSIDQAGTFALINCNAPYVQIEENRDLLPVYIGQCIPILGNKVYVRNPFSFPITLYWARGLPPQSAISVSSGDAKFLSQCMNSASALYQTSATVPATAGKKRGIGFIAARGTYQIAFTQTGGDGNEIMTFPKASLEFAALRGPGVMADSVQVLRYDGSINRNVIGISGYYTDADVTAWKAAANYTQTESRQLSGSQGTVTRNFDEWTAVFYSVPETMLMRISANIYELGDYVNERR